MNQILYTGEKDLLKNKPNKEKRNRQVKNKNILLNKQGMTLISSLLIVILIIAISINITSISNISKATQHEENQESKNVQNEVIIDEIKKNDNSSEQIIAINNEKATVDETKKENENNKIKEENLKEQTQNSNKTANTSTTKSNNVNSTTNTTTSKASTKTSSNKGYSTIAYLNIPSLKINYSVLDKTSPVLLKISLNKYWGGNPNEVGNFCIVGHNYEDSRFFGKLNKIKKGAQIQLKDMSGRTLNYTVYDKFVVGPYDTACTSQLTDGKIELTLITCADGGTTRLVVKARVD